MENAFALHERCRDDFLLTPQNFICGVIFFEYCEIKTARPPVNGFSNSQHRETTFLFLKLVNLQEISYKELMLIVIKVIDPVVYRKVTNEIRQIRAVGLDPVMEMALRLQNFLTGPNCKVSTPTTKRSLVGVFLRKLLLWLKTTDFGFMSRFSDQLLEYLGDESNDTSFDAPLASLSSSLSDISLAMDVSDGASTSGASASTSTWGMNRARNYLKDQASKLRDFPATAEPPRKLHSDLEEILDHCPDLTDVYYLAFINQLMFGEYNGAIENCHKYFIAKRDDVGNKYRLALLNIAMIHRKFGHVEQAVIALNECVDLCQQSGDKATLMHAFNWLYCTRYEMCNPSQQYTFDFFDHLRAMYNCRFKNYYEQIPLSDHTPSQCLKNLYNKWLTQKNDSSSIIAHDVAEAILWIGYGLHESAKLHCEMVLHVCQTKITPSHKDWLVINESAILALIFRSRYAMLDYDVKLADDLIDIATSLVPKTTDLKEMVEVGRLSNLCEMGLRKERYDVCSEAIQALSLISPGVSKVFTMRVLFQKGDYLPALRSLEQFRRKIDYTVLIYPIQSLLEARILIEAGSDNVFDCIIKGLTACERFHLKYLAAMFKLELIRYQNRAGYSYNALKATLHSVIPIVLSHCSREDKLILDKVIAEITPDPQKAIDRMLACYNKWNRQGDVYNQRHALNFLARKCNDLGDIERRNMYSKMFRELVTQKHPL